MSGKGDTPRPMSITPETFAQRYPMERVKAPEGKKYVVGKGWCPIGTDDDGCWIVPKFPRSDP